MIITLNPLICPREYFIAKCEHETDQTDRTHFSVAVNGSDSFPGRFTKKKLL